MNSSSVDSTLKVDVAIPCLNESSTIESCLQSVYRQTIEPNCVFVADGGSTDGTLDTLSEWTDRLPLTILHNSDRVQSAGLNMCIKRSQAQFIARLDAHTSWNDRYLEILLDELSSDTDLVAAGGVVECADGSTNFQRDVWEVLESPWFIRGPKYRNQTNELFVETLQSPVYRRDELSKHGGFRETIRWAEDDELHSRMNKQSNKRLKLNPDAVIYYVPRRTVRGFFMQCFNYGQGRGRVSNDGKFPAERHRKMDIILRIWTFCLWWNPIGWGLGLFYGLSVLMTTLQRIIDRSASLRLIYLYPGCHFFYWLGWIKTRFSTNII